MNVAIIPARGGSKRIPRKNIKNFCGKPIIAWPIEAAKASGCFDRIIVSTDDKEIAAVAHALEVETPFLRPAELANDFTGTTSVIRHAVEWLEANIGSIENACCIYATAPFVQPEDIQKGLALLEKEGCDYVFSVTSFPFPIQRAIKITDRNRIEMFQPEHFNTRSQELDVAYHDAGQFYWGTCSAWKAERIMFSDKSAVLQLPRDRVQDIDTHEDWIHAEWLFRIMQKDS